MSNEDWEKLQEKWEEAATVKRGEILQNILHHSPTLKKKEESGDHVCFCPC